MARLLRWKKMLQFVTVKALYPLLLMVSHKFGLYHYPMTRILGTLVRIIVCHNSTISL
nr:MAG TPA: hypothetical protein [Caudoviricetes sp.]